MGFRINKNIMKIIMKKSISGRTGEKQQGQSKGGYLARYRIVQSEEDSKHHNSRKPYIGVEEPKQETSQQST